MKFVLDEEKLDEKLPKDLAKAYRRDDNMAKTMNRHSYNNYRGMDVDYEAAEYTEITSDEAKAIYKSADRNNLRLVIRGRYCHIDEYDGKIRENIDVAYDKAYVNRAGKKITNVHYMPISHVFEIADKIYVTNENQSKVSPEKMKRREIDKSYTHEYTGKGYWNSHEYGTEVSALGNDRYAGMHKSDSWDKDYGKRCAEYARKYRIELKKLELDWNAGNISRNAYEAKKSELLRSIESNSKDAIKYLSKGKDSAAENRYTHARAALQNNISKYKALRDAIKDSTYDINQANQKLADLRAKGTDADKYSYERQKIAQYKADIEYAKKQLKYYEDILSSDKVTKDTVEAEQQLAEITKNLNNNKAELDKLLKRGPKTEAVDDKIQTVVNPVMADALKDQEEAEKKKEKAIEITKDGTPKLESFRLSLNEDWFDDYSDEKLTPDDFDELYATLDTKKEIEELYNANSDADTLDTFYDAVKAKFPSVEFYGWDWKESDEAMAKYEELAAAGYDISLDPSYEGTDAYGLIVIK